jgi:class 3 adenylate cyclase
VYVLREGLEAWTRAGFPTLPVDLDEQPTRVGARVSATAASATASADSSGTAHAHTFLPGLVESYANQHDLPVKRELTVLFADIADSTAAIVGRPPEEALAFVQRFMGVVTEAALAYCGDVKDYEGDGALLYFESVTEAVRAALAIREALTQTAAGDDTRIRARLSLDVGSIVIGIIGTPLRRSVALIGPSINLAARLLKQIPPDGIIATEAVVAQLRDEAPALAGRFALLDERLVLKGFEEESVTAYSLVESAA